jgi:hypothetical protein
MVEGFQAHSNKKGRVVKHTLKEVGLKNALPER